MKLLIIGHARHGKDTVAEMIRDEFGLTFKSSSEAAAEIFIYDALKNKYGYKSFIECYDDRMNHRAEWYDMICEYNKKDPSRLAKEILKRHDIYVGMRSLEEVYYCAQQDLFDDIIEVHNERKPLEATSSLNRAIFAYTTRRIQNDGTLEDLRLKIKSLPYG